MIVTRVLPSLIRLSHVIELNTIRKLQLSNCPRHLVKKLSPGTSQSLLIKTMSTDSDKELNDPKRHLDYQQLCERIEKTTAVVIDVREHSEIKETGKIPGSIHIPLVDIKTALALSDEEFFSSYKTKKPTIEDEIIFTCRSGRRSLTALSTALGFGYAKAGHYKGGWLDWAEKTGKSK